MNHLDTIARMALRGWHLLPAEPGQKQTYFKWSMVTPSNYCFSRIFAGAPLDTNVAILTDNHVVVIDLDSHGDAPNGATLFDRLDPETYKGAIVEKTPSNGYHIYYRAVQGLSYFVGNIDLDGVPVRVEVLTGRRLSYCFPSITERGLYEIISPETFLNTSPDELAPMSACWLQLVKESAECERQEPANMTTPGTNEELSDEDRKVAYVYFMEKTDYRGDGRHEQARALARCLAGIGLSESEIERACSEYIRRHGRDLTDKTEAQRLAAYGISHPLDAKPWTAIMAGRRKRQQRLIMNLIGGVKTCPAI